MWQCLRCENTNHNQEKYCMFCHQAKVKKPDSGRKLVLLMLGLIIVVAALALAFVLQSRGFFSPRVNISEDNPFNFEVWGERNSVLLAFGDVEMSVPVPAGTEELGERTGNSFLLDELGSPEWVLEIYLQFPIDQRTEENHQKFASLEAFPLTKLDASVGHTDANTRSYEREGALLTIRALSDETIEYHISHEYQGISVNVRFIRFDSFLNELFFEAYGFNVFFADGVDPHPVFAFDPTLSGTVDPSEPEVIDLPGSQAGLGMTTVPLFKGLTEADALGLIRDIGLNEGEITQDYHPTVPRGQVSAQSIEEGAFVEEGTQIELIISQGPQPDLIPFNLEVWGGNTFRIEDRGVIIEVPIPAGNMRRQEVDVVYVGAPQYSAGVRFRNWASIEEGVASILSYWPRLQTTVDSSFRYREANLEGSTLLVMERARVLADTDTIDEGYILGRREGRVVMYTKIFEYQDRIVYVILTFDEHFPDADKMPFFEAYGFGKFIEAGML